MKIYAVMRESYGLHSSVEFFKFYESRKDAKEFCDAKNNHPNTHYHYKVKSVGVVAVEIKEMSK